MPSTELLVATHNPGKVRELTAMLAAADVRCLSLDDAGVTLDVDETGTTFRDNAVLKATTYARLTGRLTLADDSGLEVDALDGAPGVYTARYGGPGLTQPERNALLLNKLGAMTLADRTARFRCVVALAGADGRLVATADGTLEGTIALTPAGAGGFGYDPIFWLPERACTLAQVSTAEKQAISHRGNALRAILPELLAILRT